jgi:hypothetical protein
MSGRLGVLLSAADEIARRAAVDLTLGRVDLNLVADRLELTLRKVRTIAECRDEREPAAPDRLSNVIRLGNNRGRGC